MSQNYAIRVFRFPEDYPAVLDLWNNAGPGIHVRRSDTPAEILKKTQRDPDLFLVAEQQGKIIGSVIGGFDGRRGLVYHLAVVESQRKQGLGQALMAELEARLHAKGCLRCYLLVTKDNEAAIRFYQASGWEIMDLHVFGKDIVPRCG